MKEELYIVGAGSFAKELAAEIQKDFGLTTKITFLVEDSFYNESSPENIKPISSFTKEMGKVIVAIADPIVRKRIVKDLETLGAQFFTFISSRAYITGLDSVIGEGSIICAGTVITVNVKIGKHAQINLNCSIGHDSVLEDFTTLAPGVGISGNCFLAEGTYFGTNSSIREKLKITVPNCVIGMQAAVVRSIEVFRGVYIGVPACLAKHL